MPKPECKKFFWERCNSLSASKAFTLAEVLITIGIIGVVAAITIPNLITNYNKKVTCQRLKKAYSELAQAVKMSENENGDVSSWDLALPSDEFFEKYLSSFIKMQKGKASDLSHLKYRDIDGDVLTLNIVASSSTATFTSMNGSIFFIDGWIPEDLSRRNVGVDINGVQGPNIVGRDYFVFTITKEGVKPVGYNVSDSEIENHCKSNASYAAPCTSWIMRNGWEIPKNYPKVF